MTAPTKTTLRQCSVVPRRVDAYGTADRRMMVPAALAVFVHSAIAVAHTVPDIPYIWNSGDVLKFRVNEASFAALGTADDNFSNVVDVISAAVQAWYHDTALDVSFDYLGTDTIDPAVVASDPCAISYNVLVVASSAPEFPSPATNQYRECDGEPRCIIRINPIYAITTSYPPQVGELDLYGLVTHEVGHCLRLAHHSFGMDNMGLGYSDTQLGRGIFLTSALDVIAANNAGTRQNETLHIYKTTNGIQWTQLSVAPSPPRHWGPMSAVPYWTGSTYDFLTLSNQPNTISGGIPLGTFTEPDVLARTLYASSSFTNGTFSEFISIRRPSLVWCGSEYLCPAQPTGAFWVAIANPTNYSIQYTFTSNMSNDDSNGSPFLSSLTIGTEHDKMFATTRYTPATAFDYETNRWLIAFTLHAPACLIGTEPMCETWFDGSDHYPLLDGTLLVASTTFSGFFVNNPVFDRLYFFDQSGTRLSRGPGLACGYSPNFDQVCVVSMIGGASTSPIQLMSFSINSVGDLQNVSALVTTPERSFDEPSLSFLSPESPLSVPVFILGWRGLSRDVVDNGNRAWYMSIVAYPSSLTYADRGHLGNGSTIHAPSLSSNEGLDEVYMVCIEP